MAADVGGLIADIGLNVAGLRQDIGKANRELKSGTNRMNRSLGKLQRGVDKAVGRFKGLVGVIGAIGFARMTQQAIANTAALSEQADAANINVETFQELTKAFSDMAGVSESITAGGLRRFNRRLGLARQGTGAAVKTLERLNISLEQDTTAALEEAIQKLTAMDSATDQAAAASQLFGEDAGPKMAAALAQGQDALDATIKKLREQGRVMSEETAASARELNDRYNELTDTLRTGFRRAVVGSIDALRDLFNVQSDVIQQQERLNELRDRRSFLLENLDKSPFPEQLRDEINKVNEEMFKLQQSIEDVRDGGGMKGGAASAAAGGGQSGTLTLLEKIDAKREDVISTAGLRRGGNPLEAFGEGAEEATEKGENFSGLMERIDDQVRETNRNADKLGFTFSSAFEDAIIKGEKLSDVMRGLWQDIQRIILRMTITKPLGNALAGAIAGGSTGNSGTAGTGGSTGPVEAFDGGGFTGRGSRTGGVDGKGGFPAILHPNETVTDHRKGGGASIQIIDQRGADAPAVETERSQGPNGKEQIRLLIKSEVNDLINRGETDEALRGRFAVRPQLAR